MKKLLISAAAAMAITTAPVHAGDAGDVAAGVFGVIILNEILKNQGNNNAGVVVDSDGRVIGSVNNRPRQNNGNTTIINNHYHSHSCGTEIRTVWTDNYRREIRDTVDSCTGQLLERREIFHRR